MKYFLLAGEASGDLHGSNLIKAIRKKDTAATFQSWGGDQMQIAGGNVVKHISELAFMGFWEVVKNLRTIKNNFQLCKNQIEQFDPDVIIFIDYPGFNLRMAKWAKQKNFTCHYYISPQLWAWNASRVKIISRTIDRMLVILPFEKEFYAQHDVEVDFVGHPLLDVTEHYQVEKKWLETIQQENDDRPIIALLPGSRKQEIKLILKEMLSVISSFPDYRFIIAGAPNIPKHFYQAIFEATPNPKAFGSRKTHPEIVYGHTYDLLSIASAALVTSGTATLETALFEVPQVVCYKGNPLSYLIARQLIKVKYISLVNLIMDRAIVRELIQSELNTKNLVDSLNTILSSSKQATFQDDYRQLKIRLGEAGASNRAAEIITQRVG